MTIEEAQSLQVGDRVRVVHDSLAYNQSHHIGCEYDVMSRFDSISSTVRLLAKDGAVLPFWYNEIERADPAAPSTPNGTSITSDGKLIATS